MVKDSRQLNLFHNAKQAKINFDGYLKDFLLFDVLSLDVGKCCLCDKI